MQSTFFNRLSESKFDGTNVAEKNNELTRIESEATLLMESSNLQDPDAAYELVGIVSSTGFESSNMMFGYFQTDDGEWYKQLDRKVEHVSHFPIIY